jgi:hypothetical protein
LLNENPEDDPEVSRAGENPTESIFMLFEKEFVAPIELIGLLAAVVLNIRYNKNKYIKFSL